MFSNKAAPLLIFITSRMLNVGTATLVKRKDHTRLTTGTGSTTRNMRKGGTRTSSRKKNKNKKQKSPKSPQNSKKIKKVKKAKKAKKTNDSYEAFKSEDALRGEVGAYCADSENYESVKYGYVFVML